MLTELRLFKVVEIANFVNLLRWQICAAVYLSENLLETSILNSGAQYGMSVS
jgi:hypothetical protein